MSTAEKELRKRRAIITCIAIFAGSRALAYIPAIRSDPIQDPLEMLMGSSAVGQWIVVAVWTVVAAIALLNLRGGKLARPVGALVGAMVAWGTAWGIGWLLDPGSIYWQTSLTYVVPAFIIATLISLLGDFVSSEVGDA